MARQRRVCVDMGIDRNIDLELGSDGKFFVTVGAISLFMFVRAAHPSQLTDAH